MKIIKNFAEFLLEAEKPESGELVISLGGTFESGKYEITNTKPIDDKMPEIIAFLNKYPKNQKMEVSVFAMESQVPNQGVKLNPGDLAQKRSDAMVEVLKEKLKDFKNVTITVQKPEIGPTEWHPEKGDKAGDKKFTDEQKVDVTIKPSGEKVILPKEGEDQYSFTVEYDGSPKSSFDGQWSIARFGTWGFTVKGLENAKKAYDLLQKAGASQKDTIEDRQRKGTLKTEKGKVFPASLFRKFDTKEKFDDFFKDLEQKGVNIESIQKMPDYFFQKPNKPGSDGYINPVENGLRQIWKANPSKASTLG